MSDKQANVVSSREEFVAFVRSLQRSLRVEPGQWENVQLADYLEAMAAWAEDMDGYFANSGLPMPQQPSWQLFAQILAAARRYE